MMVGQLKTTHQNSNATEAIEPEGNILDEAVSIFNNADAVLAGADLAVA